jgi:RimJ/RimL family protein N-acetyltransferase
MSGIEASTTVKGSVRGESVGAVVQALVVVKAINARMGMKHRCMNREHTIAGTTRSSVTRGTRTNHLGQPIGASVGDWRPPPPPARHPIEGRYCRLEPIGTHHAGELWEAYAHDTEQRNWTYLMQGPYASFEEYAAWVDRARGTRDPLFFVILAPHRAVGVAAYLRIACDSGSIEVGHIHFSPLLQRTPAATEAMYLMMKHAFELGYRRYEWKCDALNAPSRAAALRLGFTYEGTFRQATVYKGRNRDSAWYSIIDTEWPACRAAFERWLDPANFDEQGRQRTKLNSSPSVHLGG